MVMIMNDPFVAVAPSDMFSEKRQVSKEELYGQTYISINEKILDGYFDKSKFTNILEFESVDNVSVLYMIKQGLGFSVLPKLMLNKKIMFLCFSVFLSKKLSDFDFGVEGVDEFLVVRDGYDCGVSE